MFSFRLKRITEDQTGFSPSVVQSFNRYFSANTICQTLSQSEGYRREYTLSVGEDRQKIY